MKTTRIGLIIFWIAAVYIIGMGLVASYWARSVYRYLSIDQISETVWSYTSPLFGLWATAIPIGSILAGVGLLLYVRSKAAHVWLFGVGIFAVLLIDLLSMWPILPTPAHFPPLFGVGGGLILAFFLAILWFWANKWTMLEGPARTAANFQLVGYVFFLIAMWYLCGALARPYQAALAGQPLRSPISIMVYLVLGWLFLLLSHYKSAQMIQKWK
jgi:hypothetical protein